MKGVTEELPFGPETLVYKVMGKMFALTSLNDFTGFNIKVVPETGAELRERYAEIKEAYHMNKKHWITVNPTGSISDKLMKTMIEESYGLVVGGLTKKLKLELDGL